MLKFKLFYKNKQSTYLDYKYFKQNKYTVIGHFYKFLKFYNSGLLLYLESWNLTIQAKKKPRQTENLKNSEKFLEKPGVLKKNH